MSEIYESLTHQYESQLQKAFLMISLQNCETIYEQ